MAQNIEGFVQVYGHCSYGIFVFPYIAELSWNLITQYLVMEFVPASSFSSNIYTTGFNVPIFSFYKNLRNLIEVRIP